MSFRTYRVTFDGKETDYYNVIEDIFVVLEDENVPYKWFFLKPHVEITWIDHKDVHFKYARIKKKISNKLKSYNIFEFKHCWTRDDKMAEKYGCSDEECEFGYMTYALSAEMVRLFNDYNVFIKKGKGIENQYVRRCHVLANQLGLDYKKEGIFLIRRGVLCLLFWFFSRKKAVWIYEKLLRQKH
jgi:hypothetical protein